MSSKSEPCSLLCLQEGAIGPRPEPHESDLHLHTLFCKNQFQYYALI
jgi:hypothetical protein